MKTQRWLTSTSLSAWKSCSTLSHLKPSCCKQSSNDHTTASKAFQKCQKPAAYILVSIFTDHFLFWQEVKAKLNGLGQLGYQERKCSTKNKGYIRRAYRGSVLFNRAFTFQGFNVINRRDHFQCVSIRSGDTVKRAVSWWGRVFPNVRTGLSISQGEAFLGSACARAHTCVFGPAGYDSSHKTKYDSELPVW